MASKERCIPFSLQNWRMILMTLHVYTMFSLRQCSMCLQPFGGSHLPSHHCS